MNLDRLEAPVQVLNQVLYVLYPNTDTDEVVRDSKLESSIPRNACMSHARRVLNEALDTTETLSDREYAEPFEEFLALVEAAPQLEAEHSPVALHLTLDDVSLRMIGKPWIVYLLDLGLFSQKFADGFRILVMTIHSDSQGLDAAED